MKIIGQFYFPSLFPSLWFVLLAFISVSAFGQKEERRERTIDEIRVEAIHRAEVGQYPLIGLDPGDVKDAFASIHTADKDEWAAGFMRVADRYFKQAQSLEKTDPTKANADYIRAWRLYSFGRWPIPASLGKQRSYEKALEAYLAHARFMDPPLEVARIPFEGKEIIGLPAPAQECEWSSAAGDCGERSGQPQGRFNGELRRDSSLWHWLSRSRWPGDGTESDQSE